VVSMQSVLNDRVISRLEDLEMSGNMKHVREMSGKNLVMEKYPKTVHY